MSELDDTLHPEIEAFAAGRLRVDEIHELHYEQCGAPDGDPVVYLHGGPGASTGPLDRRFFDPAHFRVVLFDQRGAGRSTPAGDLRANTIEHLVADIEALRRELGIERWHVFGGSWGSTLALHYAEEHPGAIKSLVLRGIWLLRQEELDWWLYGMRALFPELWRDFAHFVSEEERGDLLSAYWRRLTGPDEALAREAAQRWATYECSACTLLPNQDYLQAFASGDGAWNLARLEAHYFRARPFASDAQLLERIDRIRHVPAFAVHGRYDAVCPVKNLDDLARAWPELSWHIVPDAGHSSREPGIARELVAATDRIARTGSPVRPA